MIKMEIIEVAKDIKHHIGWAISTAAVIALFHFLGAHIVHTPWYRVVYVYVVLMVIDLIKHAIDLQ